MSGKRSRRPTFPAAENASTTRLFTLSKKFSIAALSPAWQGPKSIARRLDSMRQAPPPHDVEFGPRSELAEMARIASGCTARLTPEQVRLGRIGRFLWLRLDVNRYHRSKTRSPPQPHFSLGHFSCQSVPFRVRERASSASGIA
jgi:hypothetical protein